MTNMPTSCVFVSVLLCAVSVYISQVDATLAISRDPAGPLYVTEGKETSLTLNITGLTKSLVLTVVSADTSIFTVPENATFILDVTKKDQMPSGENATHDVGAKYTIVIPVEGKFIGIRNLVFSAVGTGTLYIEKDIFVPHIVKVKRRENRLADAFNYILIMWLIFSYVSMGATMNWGAIWDKLKKPYGVIIGLLCQFIIMPALAFSLTKLAFLDNAAALGLIIIGCCPGGWVSNIYSLLLDCDLTLSVTMTACSTILALGTMPANLFIYGTPYTTDDDNLGIPYTWTFFQILMLIIPVLFGMLLYYKTPRVAQVLGKFLRIIAGIMIIIGLGFGLPSNLYAFYAPLNVVFVAMLLPVIGTVLGLLLAKASCLYNTSAVTVALETGAQNSLIGALVAQFSFPQPEADLISRVPLMVAMFTMGYGALVTLIYVIFKRCPGKIHAPVADEEACELTPSNNLSNDAAGMKENGKEMVPEKHTTSTDNKIKPIVHENGGFTTDEPRSNGPDGNREDDANTRPSVIQLNGSNNNSNFESFENTYF